MKSILIFSILAALPVIGCKSKENKGMLNSITQKAPSRYVEDTLNRLSSVPIQEIFKSTSAFDQKSK